MALALPVPVEQAIDRLGGRRRAAILGVGVATVVLILGVSRWAAAPTYLPLFSELPLESVSKITGQLDDNGISYHLDQGGTTLLVPSTELARARVVLASQGLPNTGRPGMELFDQPSWGMTDFTQRINYRRALEGELERTIGKMTGIESAQVHLAMDEIRTFQPDSSPKEASVVLRLRNGAAAAPDVVVGIQHLVASSVDGMVSDNVTVLDDSGRMLSAPSEPGSLAALTSRQLDMRRNVESYLENKAQQMVEQIVGPGGARIKVAAAINFDRVERTVQQLDPDGQVVTSEQKAQIIPGPEGGAGSNNVTTSYENSRSMESFTGAIGNIENLSVAVVVDDKKIQQGDSVFYQPRTAAELAQIETLVRNAVGIDERRGDRISVVDMRFAPTPSPRPEPAPTLWARINDYRSEAITIVALLLVAFVALRVIRTLGSGTEPSAPEQLSGQHRDSLPKPETDGGGRKPLTPALASTDLRTRNEVVASVTQQPELAARLVRAWLKEG